MDLIRIERGNPDEFEVAALVAVLVMLSENGAEHSGQCCEEPEPISEEPNTR